MDVMAVIVESRPELVGKRFLCVGAGGDEPPENGRWRAGVIRTVSHRELRSPELSVSRGWGWYSVPLPGRSGAAHPSCRTDSGPPRPGNESGRSLPWEPPRAGEERGDTEIYPCPCTGPARGARGFGRQERSGGSNKTLPPLLLEGGGRIKGRQEKRDTSALISPFLGPGQAERGYDGEEWAENLFSLPI